VALGPHKRGGSATSTDIFYKLAAPLCLAADRKILFFKLPDIRPDIRYPAFRYAGYLAGRISGKFNIRHIPTGNGNEPELKRK